MNIEEHVVVMNLNSKPENLRRGLRENEVSSRLAEHEVGRNNIKSFKCCEMFSSCMIEQDYSTEC